MDKQKIVSLAKSLSEFPRYKNRKTRDGLVNELPGEQDLDRSDDPQSDLLSIFTYYSELKTFDGKYLFPDVLDRLSIDPTSDRGLNVQTLINDILDSDPFKKERREKEQEIVFVNHDRQMKAIIQDNFPNRYWVLDAPAGYGKTQFIRELIKRHHDWLNIYIELPRTEKIDSSKIYQCIYEKTTKTDTKSTPPSMQDAGLQLASEIVANSIFQVNTSPDTTREIGFRLVIDNIEVLEKNILKDIMDLLGGIYRGLSNANFLNRHKFHVILSGRYAMKKVTECKGTISFVELALEPFKFSDVVGTILAIAGTRIKPENAPGLAAQIMYITGGHPGYMANILQDMESKKFVIDPQALGVSTADYQKRFIKDFQAQLSKWLPVETSELITILKTLSPLRRYGGWILEELKKNKHIEFEQDVNYLEDRLLETYLVNRKYGLLEDSITRSLLEIALRIESQSKFNSIVELAFPKYMTLFHANKFRHVEVLSSEILYIALQKFYYVDNKRNIELIEAMQNIADEIINGLSKLDDAKDVFADFHTLLHRDDEFQFKYNFYTMKNEFGTSAFDELDTYIRSKFAAKTN